MLCEVLKVNFVIYEDEEKFIEMYKKAICKLMGPSSLDYKIVVIKQYDENTLKNIENLEGNKIFIFDVEVPGKIGIDLARAIRDHDDWQSPIIVISNHEEFKKVGFTAKILMLDFISKKGNIVKDLYDTLTLALKINANQNFKFLSHGIMYQLPYNEILFFEKNANDNSSNIVTLKKKYEVRTTISRLEEQLISYPDFFKTHRSYIVNTKNIKHVDFENGMISFENHHEALLSRPNRKKLKEKMGDVLNGNPNL